MVHQRVNLPLFHLFQRRDLRGGGSCTAVHGSSGNLRTRRYQRGVRLKSPGYVLRTVPTFSLEKSGLSAESVECDGFRPKLIY